MRLSETHEWCAEQFTYPVDHTAVIDTGGTVEIEAPHGNSESISEVLDCINTMTYGSADELHETIVTYVGDGYIGRKFYDDRGPNPQDTDTVHF
jgi:hypothetical protein